MFSVSVSQKNISNPSHDTWCPKYKNPSEYYSDVVTVYCIYIVALLDIHLRKDQARAIPTFFIAM